MFAEMPLDNRTVVKFTPLSAASGFSGCLERDRQQNDLIFRSDWQFCNIEPKICQYG
jgi:hypothetical protein